MNDRTDNEKDNDPMSGQSLVPMLVAGLVLIIVGMVGALIIA